MADIIAAAIMLKNEQDTIIKTLNSIIPYMDTVFIHDTGSTDNTLELIEKWRNDNDKNVFVHKSPFVDFGYSRTELLDFCYNHTKSPLYLLLLDSNDEFVCKDTETYKEFVDFIIINYPKNKILGFSVPYHLGLGPSNESSQVSYMNAIRIICNDGSWKYKGKVHEFIYSSNEKNASRIFLDNTNNYQVMFNGCLKLDDRIRLYQDRTNDIHKSRNRWKNDAIVLQKEIDDSSENYDARTVFYLAQSYACIGDYENSIKYYKIRSTMDGEGFWEELYQSFYAIAAYYKYINKSYGDIIYAYMKAYQSDTHHIEPIIRICEICISVNQFTFAKILLDSIINKPIPNRSLNIETTDYTINRYKLLDLTNKYI